MSPRRVAQPSADWRTRAATHASSSYVRAFTRAFFGLGKDQVTAMKIAARPRTMSPVPSGRRRIQLLSGPESA
jgi:hypothetical protein